MEIRSVSEEPACLHPCLRRGLPIQASGPVSRHRKNCVMQVAGPTTRDCFQERRDIAIGGFETGNHTAGEARGTVDAGFTFDDVPSILVDKSYNGVVP